MLIIDDLLGFYFVCGVFWGFLLIFFLSPQADYLQPKLLGILAFFNMQLLSSSVGIEDKKMVRKLNFEH